MQKTTNYELRLPDGTDRYDIADFNYNSNVLDSQLYYTNVNLQSHINDTNNPHEVTAEQIGLGEVGNYKAVSTVKRQGLTDMEKQYARDNIGAGISNFSGYYNDLKEKPLLGNAAYRYVALTLDDTVDLITAGMVKVELENLDAELRRQISAIPKFSIEVVDSLPTSEISSATIYLLLSGAESQNIYTEYIYINNTWEKLGTQKIDLSGYYTSGQVDTVISEIQEELDTKPNIESLGEASVKDVDNSILTGSTSMNLPTSRAVASFVENKGYKTTDNDTTYTLDVDITNNKIVLIPSEGSVQSITVPYATNSGTVNGKTVETSVPSNAVFTDTTYQLDTGDSNGQIKLIPSDGTPQNISIKGWNTGATKAVDTSIGGDGNISLNLPTTAAVVAYVSNNYITKAVNDLTNYYLKTETYTKNEVNSLISSIPKFSIKVVAVLPTTDISSTTIYLVRTDSTSQNLYTEYIYVDNNWEILGSQEIDLSGYYTANEIDTLLNGKVSVGDIGTAANKNAISSVDNSTDIPTSNAVKTFVEGKGYISGTGDNGYLAKFNGSNTVTSGPQFGNSTSTFLRNDGNWAIPEGSGTLSLVVSNGTLSLQSL